ncbi:MAG: hypothetical protein AAF327_21995 [Cyanobacteria bacterium P01_A01_bin.37]
MTKRKLKGAYLDAVTRMVTTSTAPARTKGDAIAHARFWGNRGCTWSELRGEIEPEFWGVAKKAFDRVAKE